MRSQGDHLHEFLNACNSSVVGNCNLPQWNKTQGFRLCACLFPSVALDFLLLLIFLKEINMVVCLFWLGSVRQRDQGHKVFYQISQMF